MLLAFADKPQRQGWLTIFPVVAADHPEMSYVLITDAIRRGVVTVEEKGGGSPPHLVARNRGSDPVLLLDCETFHGMQDNHSTNQTVLLGPDSVTKVPISCMDPGKWSCEEMQQGFMDSYENFPLLDGQVGVLAFFGKQLLGLDALGTPELYASVHRRLVTGYLMTALSAGPPGTAETPAKFDDLRALATSMQDAERVSAPCVGSGEYSTLHGRVTGGELRHNGHLVHLSVFPNGAVA